MKNFFKITLSMMALILSVSSTSFAGPEDTQWEHVLSCRVENMNLHSIEAYKLDQNIILELINNKGEITSLGLTSNDFEKSELYLKHEGDLSLFLLKNRVDQFLYDYSIFIKGDGYNYSFPIDCSK